MDNTLVLWSHGRDQPDQFHKHLNSLHPQIQFNRAVAIDNRINFRDVVVKMTMEGFSTSVYRKPTHTDIYTHFISHHHPHVKSGMIRCLADRAERICDVNNRQDEFSHIRDTLKENGYPNHIISRALKFKHHINSL